MLTMEFQGHRKLTDAFDAAVALPDDAAVADALRRAMCGLIRDPEVRLPACVLQPVTEHYARRELYRCELRGYSVIAMTWGPGQGTPIHDHAGMWCVEGVWHGQLEITQYEFVGEQPEGCTFKPAGTINAGFGSAGSLIPPYEYHTIRNPSADTLAVSLHVYKGEMRSCCVFHPIAGQLYRRATRELGLDQARC
ncbi:MAG: cysteine dioxygenase family protein [Xanthomonadaceae bacterium]|nr:cysteine dioxygenase family protein [Xanthomonadaceae bacterium]